MGRRGCSRGRCNTRKGVFAGGGRRKTDVRRHSPVSFPERPRWLGNEEAIWKPTTNIPTTERVSCTRHLIEGNEADIWLQDLARHPIVSTSHEGKSALWYVVMDFGALFPLSLYFYVSIYLSPCQTMISDHVSCHCQHCCREKIHV
jgi:hypothetical protein